MIDWTAYTGVATLRLVFDLLSGYKLQKKMDTLDERAVLSRCIFLETVAGGPGFAAGMMRHLQSLRKMERDHGWIHTLLEEAENERMHLMTFMQLRRPGLLFRFVVINTQIIFTLCFCLSFFTCFSWSPLHLWPRSFNAWFVFFFPSISPYAPFLHRSLGAPFCS